MAFIGKKLYARLFMGGRLVLHLLSRLDPTVRRRRGLGRFQQSFFPEGLLPPTPLVRELLPIIERCNACDLCLGVESDGIGPRDMVLRAARSSGDWPVLAPLLASDRCHEQAEAICPQRIPFRLVARAIREASVVGVRLAHDAR